MRRFVGHLAGGLVLAVSAMVSGAQTEGSFERTLTVSGPVELFVSSGTGNLTLESGSAGTVQIRAEIRARSSSAGEVRHLESNPPITQDGNIIRVGPIEEREQRRHIAVSYRIVVPVVTRLVAETGSGSQRIGDIAGPVESSSGSGSLDIGRIEGDVNARTGSGSIEIDGVAGSLKVVTGSGSIRAEDVAGPIIAESGSGSVEIEQTASGDVSVETGSGGIRLSGVRGALRADTGSGNIEARGVMAFDWSLDARSGRITVELADDAGFELDASSRSGSIDVEHPITVQGLISSKRIRGSVRGGGPRLSLHTSSGSIRIR